MNEIKRLRRKLGIAALLLACLFMTGWLRSTVSTDDLEIRTSTAQHYFTSMDGYFRWSRRPGQFPAQSPIWTSKVGGARSESQFEYLGFVWRLNWWNFDIGSGRWPDGSACEYVTLPYAAITIPLILLAGYLLLSRPRLPRQATIAGTTQK